MAELEYFKTIVKELEELRKENAELREENTELLAKNEEYELGIKYLRADYEKLENFNRVKDDLDREAERLAEHRKQKAEALKEYERSLLSHISGLEDRLSESCESLKHLIMNAENNLGKNAGVSKTIKEFEEEKKAAREVAVEEEFVKMNEDSETEALVGSESKQNLTKTNLGLEEAMMADGVPPSSMRMLGPEKITKTFCLPKGAAFLNKLGIVPKHNCVNCGAPNCQKKFHSCISCSSECSYYTFKTRDFKSLKKSGYSFMNNMMCRKCDNPYVCNEYADYKYYLCNTCAENKNAMVVFKPPEPRDVVGEEYSASRSRGGH